MDGSRCQHCGRVISIHALREEGDGNSCFRFQPHFHFYPRPPRGGRHRQNAEKMLCSNISIHALREEGDQGPPVIGKMPKISIHALREEGDAIDAATLTLRAHFYPRPPRGGRPLYLPWQGEPLCISIHALREEGDPYMPEVFHDVMKFLSTPSARRATDRRGGRPGYFRDFYPRPPRGGRPLSACCFRGSLGISIHALREEGDTAATRDSRCWCRFLSTPSARRATSTLRRMQDRRKISIHALREEGDLACAVLRDGNAHISIHALREEGDLSIAS